jgi:hypothetical protein
MKKSGLFRNLKNKIILRLLGFDLLLISNANNSLHDWKGIQFLLQWVQEHDLGPEVMEDHPDKTLYYVCSAPALFLSRRAEA